MKKIIKWGANYLRLICLKAIYGNAFQVDIFCKKPAYIGKSCKVEINGAGRVVLGREVYLDNYCHLNADGGIIELGQKTYFNTYCRIAAQKRIKIGRNCIFGSNVSVYDHDHDVSKGVLAGYDKYVKETVEVEDEVWFGTNVVITKGCRIERNCVIGANAVVTKSIGPNSVCGGIPAKCIKILRKPE